MFVYEVIQKIDRIRKIMNMLDQRKKVLKYLGDMKNEIYSPTAENVLHIKHKYFHGNNYEEDVYLETNELEDILRLSIENLQKELKTLKNELEGTTINTLDIPL